MLEIKSAREAGFDTDAPRWLIYKDGAAIIQMHLYEEFYTLFWRGSVSVVKLRRALSRIVAEFKETFSFDSTVYTRGNGLVFADHSKFKDVPFVLHPHSGEERKINKDYLTKMRSLDSEPRFIRWDMDGPFPLILWGGTSKNSEEETGFSSRRMIPNAILGLCRDTGEHGFTRKEHAEIKKMLEGKLPAV